MLAAFSNRPGIAIAVKQQQEVVSSAIGIDIKPTG